MLYKAPCESPQPQHSDVSRQLKALRMIFAKILGAGNALYKTASLDRMKRIK